MIIATRAPDVKDDKEPDEDQALMSASDDIMSAIESRDSRRLAQAIRSAFEICDSAPHVEGPHLDEEEA